MGKSYFVDLQERNKKKIEITSFYRDRGYYPSIPVCYKLIRFTSLKDTNPFEFDYNQNGELMPMESFHQYCKSFVAIRTNRDSQLESSNSLSELSTRYNKKKKSTAKRSHLVPSEYTGSSSINVSTTAFYYEFENKKNTTASTSNGRFSLGDHIIQTVNTGPKESFPEQLSPVFYNKKKENRKKSRISEPSNEEDSKPYGMFSNLGSNSCRDYIPGILRGRKPVQS